MLICQVHVRNDLLIVLQAENVFFCVRGRTVRQLSQQQRALTVCAAVGDNRKKVVFSAVFFKRFRALVKFNSSCLPLSCLLGRLITVIVLARLYSFEQFHF